ncbi:hypothetical protein BGW42_002861 [Actinomortierella wolfii]|nr:hypothetical protein BGW42_002861 [Actinomortierella wolfii]
MPNVPVNKIGHNNPVVKPELGIDLRSGGLSLCLTTQKSTATVFGIAFGYSDVMDEDRRRMHLLIIKSKAPPTSLSDLEWTLVHATPLDKLSLLTKHTLGYWFCNIDSAGSITALAIDDTRSSPEPYVIIHFDPAGVKVNSTYTTTEPNWWQANISAGFDRGLLVVHTRGSLVNITDDYHVLDSGPVALGQAGTSTLSTGAIISITIGALAVLALACFVIIQRRRRMALTRRIEDESIQKQPENDEEMTLQGKAEMDKSSVENDKIAMEQDGASNAIGNQSRSEQTGDTSESPNSIRYFRLVKSNPSPKSADEISWTLVEAVEANFLKYLQKSVIKMICSVDLSGSLIIVSFDTSGNTGVTRFNPSPVTASNSTTRSKWSHPTLPDDFSRSIETSTVFNVQQPNNQSIIYHAAISGNGSEITFSYLNTTDETMRTIPTRWNLVQ